MTGNAAHSLVAALNWWPALLLGSLATVLAGLAVAGTGFGMLSGRANRRRAVGVIFGCVIIFGAAQVAGGLLGVGERDALGSDRRAISSGVAPRSALAQQEVLYDPFVTASPIYQTIDKAELAQWLAGELTSAQDKAAVAGVYVKAKQVINRLSPHAEGLARVWVTLDGQGRPIAVEITSRMLNPVVTLRVKEQLETAKLQFSQKSRTVELPAFLIGTPESIR